MHAGPQLFDQRLFVHGLLDQLLREQQDLSGVDRFAQAYAGGEIPALAKHYSALLPASPPGPGQQYGFEVDLDRCSGCKACVTACHALNGLDEHETWRDVGLLIGGTSSLPVLQHVTTACHHCLEPACMEACPVNAYEKDPLTGIVRHLDDQCFGCQYCTLACPYDVPKYHPQKGIVRKCDMCSQRLAAGEAPACVQACPQGAIAIRVVDVRQVIEDAEANVFLPGAPEPHLTLPTTTYKTQRVFPRNLLPADYHSVSPQHAHPPLILMLVLTQLSVGAFLCGLILEWLCGRESLTAFTPLHSAGALGFGMLALAASVLHLGRPQYAYRALLGLGHSWLSREILAFGLFAAAAAAFAGSHWLVPAWAELPAVHRSLQLAVACNGLAGVGCSVMIYAATQREFWSATRTGLRFVGTMAVLGPATVWLSLLVVELTKPSLALQALMERTGGQLCAALMAATAAKLAFEAAVFRHAFGRQATPLQRSARLMAGPLSNAMLARFACGLLGGLMMPGFLLRGGGADWGTVMQTAVVGLLFAACLAGELLERYLFFAAVAAPRMPGGIRS